MTSKNKYPFEQINIFLISLSFSRKPSIPDQIELPITVEAKVIEPGFPRLQVNLEVKSPTDTNIAFNTEAVGIFDYVGEKKEYDKDINKEFIEEKALYLIWTYVDQLVSIITGQMGMNPIKLKAPINLELKLASQEKKKE